MAHVRPPGDDAELARRVLAASGRGMLARGLGRSYGDAAQNAGGTVLDMTQRNRILSVDADAALVRVESGVSLNALMRALLPKGLFVPVSPGTRQVTVGGAIAADVHGKNHHVDGSFGRHVVSMTLLLADGTVREVGPPDPVFWATVGGMGLTGVILSATVRLKRVETAYCVVDTQRIPDLDELLWRMSEEDDRYTYSVAWVDTSARGRSLGRSVLTRGWSARRDQLPERLGRHPLDFHPRQRLVAPPVFPSGLLNKVSVGAFNRAWYVKAPKERRGEIQDIATFFHPLDGVGRWNRIYGPRGFVQFQMAVPLGAERALEQCLELVGSAGQGSFLAVVKRFGEASPGHLSFPMPGWTLALDLPVASAGLVGLLNRLDNVVLSAGGREYLAKDSRLPGALLPAMYPRLDEWRAVRESVDPGRVWSSDLSRRLGL
ncbi:MAG: FAD-binding oxidoreductase [Actinomycetota bacterium]|nr:FAD-binding oxidoreductase [Actinomycetota bacterium]